MNPKIKELLNYDLNVKTLGESLYDSPLNLSDKFGDNLANYVSDRDRIFVATETFEYEILKSEDFKKVSFEKAGPREKIYFKSGETVSAIVTCGGLCPGLNAVIRALVLMNYYRYGNKKIYGIKHGYKGFVNNEGNDIIELTPKIVEDIHKTGGTFLGSSRGPQDIKKIVDKLDELKINVLYTVGGDGTLKGAHEIYKEINKRNLKISVIGVPKTIDNDISYVDKTFGTETAFSKACESIDAAHVEAKGVYNGIGLVKVMGRESGFIAAYTTLATNDVNFTLIPEVKFKLEGENGFFEHLKKRLIKKNHAVILVAEGAGQDLFEGQDTGVDASGNKKLVDIGIYLKDKIKEYFALNNIPADVKYIDPSYIIRSTPPTPNDAVFCLQLAQRAVHAGMSGKTDIVIGYLNGEFIHLPIEIAISKRNTIDPESELWLSVLETTGQPANMR